MNNSNQNPRPDNNLIWAILSTLFCCLPLGIVSIIYAAKVDGLYRNGDYEDACEAAENSRKYAKWAAISGVIILVITIIFEIFIIGVAASTSDDGTSTNTELVLENDDDITELRAAIEAEVSSSNADLPEEISDNMTLSSMQLKGDYIVYRVECDENAISIDGLKESKLGMKKAMKEYLQKEFGSDLENIKKANIGYIMEYVGDQSGDICSIKIEASEL